MGGEGKPHLPRVQVVIPAESQSARCNTSSLASRRPPHELAMPVAYSARRVPPPSVQYYAAPSSSSSVQQTLPYRRVSSGRGQHRRAQSSQATVQMPPVNHVAHGVATGSIGAGFGPYAVCWQSSVFKCTRAKYCPSMIRIRNMAHRRCTIAHGNPTPDPTPPHDIATLNPTSQNPKSLSWKKSRNHTPRRPPYPRTCGTPKTRNWTMPCTTQIRGSTPRSTDD